MRVKWKSFTVFDISLAYRKYLGNIFKILGNKNIFQSTVKLHAIF